MSLHKFLNTRHFHPYYTLSFSESPLYLSSGVVRMLFIIQVLIIIIATEDALIFGLRSLPLMNIKYSLEVS